MSDIKEITSTETSTGEAAMSSRDFYYSKKSKGCPYARLHSGVKVKSSTNFKVDEYAIAIGVIKRILMGIKDDIKELVSEGYVNISDIDKTQAERERVLVAILERYRRGENRQKYVSFPEAKVLGIPSTWKYAFEGSDAVKVCPDAMFITEDYKTKEPVITLVYYRTGRPDCIQQNRKGSNTAADDKSLYWLIRFGEEIAKEKFPGKVVQIEACHYFLKKTTDKKDSLYYDGFFDGCGGNVVSLCEKFDPNPDAPRSELDMHFEEVFEKFALGYECQGDDCLHCFFEPDCHYVKAPEVFEEKQMVKARKKPTPSEQQQAVINFAKGTAICNAAPGSGKTETLKERVLHLIRIEVEKAQKEE